MAAKDAGPDSFAPFQTVFLDFFQECEIASGHSVSKTQETVHQGANDHLLFGVILELASVALTLIAKTLSSDSPGMQSMPQLRQALHKHWVTPRAEADVEWNDDLVGFFNAVPRADILRAVHSIVTDYRQLTIALHKILKHGVKSAGKPVPLEPLIKQSSGHGHPVIAAREKRAGSTGRCDVVAYGQHELKVFQASSNMARRKATLWKLIPILSTRAWDQLQLKVGIPQSFFPGLKVVKKLLDADAKPLGGCSWEHENLYWCMRLRNHCSHSKMKWSEANGKTPRGLDVLGQCMVVRNLTTLFNDEDSLCSD